VSQLDGRRWFHKSHKYRDVEELEECPGDALMTQDVKVALGFREFNLDVYPWA